MAEAVSGTHIILSDGLALVTYSLPQPIVLKVHHEGPVPTRHTTSHPTISNISNDHAEDVDDSGNDTENQPITNGTRKKVRSGSGKKESTRGRNRNDLPQQYNISDGRFNSRFLPEVQHLYGLEPDPWSPPTLALVQRARDKVFTEFQDTLTTKGAVFRNVCRKLHHLFV